MKRKEFLALHSFGIYNAGKEIFIQKDLHFKKNYQQQKIKIMKLQSNNLLENLTSKELKILTSEIKETIYTEFKKGKKRKLSAAELWDLRRRKKNLLVKRFIF